MKPKSPVNAKDADAEDRVAAALRDNLRKRKAQQEARGQNRAKAN